MWDLSGKKGDEAVLDYSSPAPENGVSREDRDAQMVYEQNVSRNFHFRTHS